MDLFPIAKFFSKPKYPRIEEKYFFDLKHAVLSNRQDEVTEILDSGLININAQDEHGWTVLMFSCKYSRDSTNDMVNLLLDKGADMNLINKRGYTALKYAVEFSNATSQDSTVELLLNRGCNPSST